MVYVSDIRISTLLEVTVGGQSDSSGHPQVNKDTTELTCLVADFLDPKGLKVN